MIVYTNRGTGKVHSVNHQIYKQKNLKILTPSMLVPKGRHHNSTPSMPCLLQQLEESIMAAAPSAALSSLCRIPCMTWDPSGPDRPQLDTDNKSRNLPHPKNHGKDDLWTVFEPLWPLFLVKWEFASWLSVTC